MLGQIIVTAIGIVALIIGLWTIKEMKQKQHSKNKSGAGLAGGCE
jgi:FtsZ-interacting cell division protein ZipA